MAFLITKKGTNVLGNLREEYWEVQGNGSTSGSFQTTMRFIRACSYCTTLGTNDVVFNLYRNSTGLDTGDPDPGHVYIDNLGSTFSVVIRVMGD